MPALSVRAADLCSWRVVTRIYGPVRVPIGACLGWVLCFAGVLGVGDMRSYLVCRLAALSFPLIITALLDGLVLMMFSSTDHPNYTDTAIIALIMDVPNRVNSSPSCLVVVRLSMRFVPILNF